MTASRPAAGGGRWVEVAPERLGGWLARLEDRHGACVRTGSRWEAADGTVAEVEVPWPPVTGDLLAHCLRPRRLGVLLVRLGGHAVGVAEGESLVVSKVGGRPVHGRSAAGGWSQHRFARRREGQVRVALEAAATTAAQVLAPHAPTLAGLVVGGERTAVDAVLADRRLAAIAALPRSRLIDVPDPRLAVLQTVPRLSRAVRIRVVQDGA